MGEVIVLKKSHADKLLAHGFKYRIREIDNRRVFVFIQTPQLMEELSSGFDAGSFLINRTFNF